MAEDTVANHVAILSLGRLCGGEGGGESTVNTRQPPLNI